MKHVKQLTNSSSNISFILKQIFSLRCQTRSPGLEGAVDSAFSFSMFCFQLQWNKRAQTPLSSLKTYKESNTLRCVSVFQFLPLQQASPEVLPQPSSGKNPQATCLVSHSPLNPRPSHQWNVFQGHSFSSFHIPHSHSFSWTSFPKTVCRSHVKKIYLATYWHTYW